MPPELDPTTPPPSDASHKRLIEQALRDFGIDPEFYDIWGNLHRVGPPVAKAILRSQGVVWETPEQLGMVLAAKRRRDWSRLLPGAVVTSASAPQVRVRFRPVPGGRLTAVLNFESGRQERWSVATSELQVESAEASRIEVDGEHYVEAQLPIPLSELPIGYHQLQVRLEADGVDANATTRLILCPDRAHSLPPNQSRCAGVAVSLYGLRSKRNWGAGDFTDLRELCRWAFETLGASFVALNPLHSIANRTPYNTSPYLPNSILFKNPLYLDIERVPEFANSPWARKLFASPRIQKEIQELRDAEFVEYERVWRLKFVFLKLLFRRFLADKGEDHARSQAFRSYIYSEGAALHRYAVYCALDEHLHRADPNLWIWPDWPEEYRDPESEATRAFAERNWRSVLLHKYIQWLVDDQLREAHHHARSLGMPVGLYHDLALATDRCGSDLWAYRDFYVNGCRVGSPPDDFSPKGQDWAFPPPSRTRHLEDGYRLFVETIRKNMRHGGALRIDHVMRFFRLYWIPDGFDATSGTYVRDAAEDLIRLLALESVRYQVAVVGEDLGTVEPGIREVLQKFGVLSYRLLYFERNEAGEFRLPHEYPKQSLVSVSTHDLPTLRGFWEGKDIEAREKAGLFHHADAVRGEWENRTRDKQKMLDLFLRLKLLPDWFPRSAAQLPEFTGELHNAAIGFLASANSDWMCLNQEDITKDPDQQNLPATTSQYPNWRHKMQYSIEDLHESKTARDFSLMVRSWLERTGRLARQA
jgi:4-alpha-glucanotransferase